MVTVSWGLVLVCEIRCFVSRSSTVTLMPLQLEGVVKVTSEKAALRKAMEKEVRLATL